MKTFWKWFGAVLTVVFSAVVLAQPQTVSPEEKAALAALVKKQRLDRLACKEVAAKTPIKDMGKPVQEQKTAYASCMQARR